MVFCKSAPTAVMIVKHVTTVWDFDSNSASGAAPPLTSAAANEVHSVFGWCLDAPVFLPSDASCFDCSVCSNVHSMFRASKAQRERVKERKRE